jgi:hypothetical protein
MIVESEVREKLAAVASNKLPLFDFADWLDSKSWNMHRDSSPEAVKLVSSIELLFAEYDHGDLDEAQLRRELLGLLGFVVLRLRVSLDLDEPLEPEVVSANSSPVLAPVVYRVPA